MKTSMIYSHPDIEWPIGECFRSAEDLSTDLLLKIMTITITILCFLGVHLCIAGTNFLDAFTCMEVITFILWRWNCMKMLDSSKNMLNCLWKKVYFRIIADGLWPINLGIIGRNRPIIAAATVSPTLYEFTSPVFLKFRRNDLKK